MRKIHKRKNRKVENGKGKYEWSETRRENGTRKGLLWGWGVEGGDEGRGGYFLKGNKGNGVK